MAKATQFNFTWKEVAQALIKDQSIHEGRWTAGIEVGVAIGLFPAGAPGAPIGPDARMSPGGLFLANNVVLSVAQPDTPASLVVDASEFNPAPKE